MINQEEDYQEEELPEAVDFQEEVGDSLEVGDTLEEEEDPLEQHHLEEDGAHHLHPFHKEETTN